VKSVANELKLYAPKTLRYQRQNEIYDLMNHIGMTLEKGTATSDMIDLLVLWASDQRLDLIDIESLKRFVSSNREATMQLGDDWIMRSFYWKSEYLEDDKNGVPNSLSLALSYSHPTVTTFYLIKRVNIRDMAHFRNEIIDVMERCDNEDCYEQIINLVVRMKNHWTRKHLNRIVSILESKLSENNMNAYFNCIRRIGASPSMVVCDAMFSKIFNDVENGLPLINNYVKQYLQGLRLVIKADEMSTNALCGVLMVNDKLPKLIDESSVNDIWMELEGRIIDGKVPKECLYAISRIAPTETLEV